VKGVSRNKKETEDKDCRGSRDKDESEDKNCARTLALVHSKSLPLESLSSFVDILIIVTRPCSVATLTPYR
jgi:hypothetical protein